MPQDRYTDRHAADRWDDEYDDDDDDSWDDNYADDDASRAVVAYDESRQLGLPEEDRSLGYNGCGRFMMFFFVCTNHLRGF